MLQKSQTKKLNQVKYVLLIPLIAVFLYSFNTKEVFIPKKFNSNLKEIDTNSKDPNSANPIHKEKKIDVSSSFNKDRVYDSIKPQKYIVKEKKTKYKKLANIAITSKSTKKS